MRATQPHDPPALRWGAVVLAAGAGSRLGYRPKGLLLRDGVPLLRRLCGLLLDAGAASVVVVLGHHAERLRPVLDGLPVQAVLNPRPDEHGLPGSQRLGLAALPDGLDAVLLALADQPLLEAADVQALLAAWQARAPQVRWLQPQVDGQPGHPVLIDDGVRREVLAASAPFGLKAWRGAHAAAAAAWPTSNRHYTTDIDTEQDIARLAADNGVRLGWPSEPA